ncbi:a625760c-f1cc-4517-9673-09ed24537b3d [Sclerotinia trifoliorum]|uniref:A625760c-f1cc-4517-9673-09ed24537b3d n=1 Tax=Sclerotinia trifoliorum TaxID=28548 RepID=A0A8H2VSJ8_9HELO|nr:a625760c-f1cc-4517-9673-09ed24537b3d [Sclerotinia trifoliorum]
MVVRIRLARFGRKRQPIYNIVVAQARSARNSLPIEVLGTYDPQPKLPADGEGQKFKDIRLDSLRAKYWLGVGAQPSKTAWRLLSMAGLLEPQYTAKSEKPTPPNSSKPILKADV